MTADDALATGQQAVDRSLRRVRVFTAALMFVHFLGYRPMAGPSSDGDSPVVLALVLAVVLLLNNVLSLFASRTGGRAARLLRIAELIVDVGVALAMSSVVHVLNDDVSWVLLVVPVLEAAVRYRLTGAIVTWGVTATLYVVGTLESLADPLTGDLTAGFDDLQVAVQRVAVILLVATPISYLSEHLVHDIEVQRVASARARHRGQLLMRVADLGHRISRLGTEVDETLLRGVLTLGFDGVDVCIPDRHDPSVYRVSVRSGRLRLPGATQSTGLVADALARRAPVRIDVPAHSIDPRRAADAQDPSGVALVACMVPVEPHAVVVRAAFAPAQGLSAERIESFELLCRQAAVALGNDQLVQELSDAKDHIEFQALHDTLTKLPNRALFLQLLTEALQQRTAGRDVAVLFVDLDRFKPVNDRFGHAVGDELLIAVAQRLRGAVRANDVVARLGGDEFCVLTVVERPGEADAVARGVSAVMREPFDLSVHEVTVSASVGVALADAAADVDPGELMRRADVSMYDAKAKGKATVRFFSADLDSRARERIDMEHELRRALRHGTDLSVVYQPLACPLTGRVLGAEALARWHHPVIGVIEPSVFVPLAEDTGTIDALGELVLTTACTAAARWPPNTDGRRPLISVNVSWHQLQHPMFLTRVDDALAAAGLAPERLMLEIAERWVALTDNSIALISALRRRGIRIALDDFGKGETSLRHLGAFEQLDVIKLDRDLVRNAGTVTGRVILELLIEMAHRLGLEVIAEGVECRAHLDITRELGCDLVQGFLLHRTMADPEFVALLETPLTPTMATSRGEG